MARGAILVLDEINATSPDCLFILHGLLDEDRRITLPNGEIITPHENFRVFATCNPDYEGTKSMNKAFLDRFPIVVTVDVLQPAKEKALLVKRTGITEELAEQIVTIATMARKDYTEQKIMSYISTRGLLHIAKLIKAGLEPKNAYETTIVKKTNNKEEQKILTDFFLAVFKQASGDGQENLDVPYITTKREIRSLEENYRIAREQRDKADQLRTEADSKLSQSQRDLERAVIEANNNGKLATDQADKIKDMQKSLDSYKRLEEILAGVSKDYKPIQTISKPVNPYEESKDPKLTGKIDPVENQEEEPEFIETD
jgi:MoxR-like ATPase